MAIPTGTGTEVLKAHSFEDINVLLTDLIIGIKHHTYTVLSYISHCTSVGSAAMSECFNYDVLMLLEELRIR